MSPTEALAEIAKIHRPLFEDGIAVGCAACDWEQPSQDVWPCPTELVLAKIRIDA